MKKQLNECIIVAKKVSDAIIMVKNRDRAYKPELEIVHEIVDGVEIAYLRDMVTDWSEGLNEYGIGILNTALMVGFDENEKKIVKKGGKKSKDGNISRITLTKKTIGEALRTMVTMGLRGHTFISDPQKMVTIEMTSKHNPKMDVRDLTSDNYVRTNHGNHYHDAGYTDGDDFLSSKMRMIGAEKIANDAQQAMDILNGLKKQMYDKDSILNMRRDTDKMSTSSQLMLNLTNRELTLHYFKSKVEKFNGVVNRLPEDYTPKIKIHTKEIDI